MKPETVMPPPRASFEDMAGVYDSFTGDVQTLSRLEGLSLDAILRKFGSQRILDCACGTGIQALALADRGYEVFASDISTTMVSILRRKARSRGLGINPKVADFRDLSPWQKDSFDAVICAGNSLGVLRDRRQMIKALKAMKSRLKTPEGVLVLGLRNYRRLRRLDLGIVSRAALNPNIHWYDIRVFGREHVDVAYVRLVRRRDSLVADTWVKSYSYLDPREAVGLLRRAGFPYAQAFDIKGLGPYRGGEWGFTTGSWRRPTKAAR